MAEGKKAKGKREKYVKPAMKEIVIPEEMKENNVIADGGSCGTCFSCGHCAGCN